MQTHVPPTGESIVHHTDAGCPCKPIPSPITKRVSSGRGGSHQGFQRVGTRFQHNPLPVRA